MYFIILIPSSIKSGGTGGDGTPSGTGGTGGTGGEGTPSGAGDTPKAPIVNKESRSYVGRNMDQSGALITNQAGDKIPPRVAAFGPPTGSVHVPLSQIIGLIRQKRLHLQMEIRHCQSRICKSSKWYYKYS